nr:PP2C family protein-serine/threonine phosphatase [Pararoseomonas indoligenes]
MIPARQVGGDLYDAVRLAPGLLLAGVADVSGKGAPAGLTMARTLGLIRAAAVMLSAGGAVPDPAAILARANDDLSRENDSQTFVTVVLAAIDAASGTGRIALAGHEPPFILGNGAARVLTGLSRQPPLGTMEDYPYRSDPLALAPGEALFLFSDGVTEAEDDAEGFFGRDRLADRLEATADAPPRAVVEAVLDAVTAFAGGAPQADDITVLAVRRG